MKKRSAISLLVGTLVFASVTKANEQGEVTERARLANVMVEIAYLQQYLQETKNARKHHIRTRFNYDKLNQELDLMKSGIGEYVDQQLTQPKPSSVSSQVITGSYQQ